MNKRLYELRAVETFMRVSGQECFINLTGDKEGRNPNITKKLIDFRISLITEEFKELCDAIAAYDYDETVDALADLLYVLIGSCIAFGLPYRVEGWMEKYDAAYFDKHIDMAEISSDTPECPNIENEQEMEEFLKEWEIYVAVFAKTIYYYSFEEGINIIKAFEIVHDSNMTKFCKTEEEAIKSCAKLSFPAIYEKRHDAADNAYYVILHKDTGKILKGINFMPPNFINL